MTPQDATEDVLAYLLDHTDRVGECYIWRGNISGDGYGRCRWDGTQVKVHRLAYATFVGPLGPDDSVCHRCDTPACWRPDHLFRCTRAENMADRAAKGRYYTDEGVSTTGMNVLQPEQVRRIRRRYALGGISEADLAQIFHVSQGTVHAIVTGRTWTHLHEEALSYDVSC